MKWKMKEKEGINLRTKKSRIYVVILFVLVIGFASFLSSKLYLPEHSSYYHTELNTDINITSASTLMIHSWTYNPKKNFMEVAFKIDGEEADDYTFEGVEKANPQVPLPIKKVYQDENQFVLQIENVSPDWGAIALDIYKVHSNVSDIDFNDVNQEINVNEEKEFMSTIYADQRKTEQSGTLSIKRQSEYAVYFVQKEQEKLKKQIQKYDMAIEIENKNQTKLAKEIMEVEEELEFQTEGDKADSQAQISSKTDAINQSKETIKGYQSEQENLRAKIEKLDVKIDSIQKEWGHEGDMTPKK
ncbi:hypothetical protein [Bacillus sp. JJ722]|uniref:hypothetical protein n=1 Tax=Bacillus sp. JJ722 TaxID=3122973 RepID=UPI003000A759